MVRLTAPGTPATSEKGGISVFSRITLPACHDAAAPDPGAVHEDRPHPDQAVVGHAAAVNHAAVADRHALADGQREPGVHVAHGEVLDIAFAPDDDGLGVGADDTVEPDRGMRSDGHVADHDGAGGQINQMGR